MSWIEDIARDFSRIYETSAEKSTMNIFIPEGKTLMPFQVDGAYMMIRFMGTHTKGSYCADEQGLGKTIQAIAALNSVELRGPVLIVCPAVMRHTWMAELKEWALATRLHVAFKQSDLPSASVMQNLNYLVISYNLAATHHDKLSLVTWGALVLDEAHYVKNATAQRSKAILTHLWPKAQYRLALSGTPITNHVIDLYSIFNKFLPSIFPKHSEFGARYAYARATPYSVKYEGLRKDNAPELSKIMRDNFYFRRRKDEVLKDLPAKVFKKVTLGKEYLFKGDQEQIEQIDVAIAAMLRRLESSESMPPFSETIQGYRRMQGELIAPAVIEYCKELLEEGIPVVLFAYHRNVLKMLKDGLHKYAPVVIEGGMGAANAKRAVDAFQGDETNLFIGQINAAGIGITLTRSSNVVLAEPDWSPATIAQAVDRCHRIGQKDSVTVHFFTIPESIVDEIITALMKKAKDHAEIVEN